MTELDKLASERVLKARTEIILTNRFYGVLVSNVEPVLSRAFPTAGTNGKKHFFNPDFVNKLTQKQLKFVQRHESEHDARHHSTRRGGRDPQEWNICCDHSINVDLLDEMAAGDHSMEVPPPEVLGGGICADVKYRGMSAEDIYRCRELDRQRAEQEKQKQQSEQSQESEEADDNESDASPSQAGDEKSSDASGDDQPDDGKQEETEPGSGQDAGNETDERQDGSADGGEGSNNADEALSGESEASDTEDEDGTEGEAADKPSSVTGDQPGGMGEVLDATDDPAEASDEEAKWERVVRQAASMAKKAGDLPGHVTREIDRANKPKQDWREVLRAYFDQGASRIETWNRPNRRFAGRGMLLPGSQREGLNSVVFLVDTSGSVDEVALQCVAAEAQAALDEGIIDTLHVVYGDVEVTRTDEYVPGDTIDFDPRGGGGTRMQPLFQWASENVDNPSLVVCFTDLYIEAEEHLGPQPACPVLWAVHGYPHVVRDLIANAPWREPGVDVGSH